MLTTSCMPSSSALGRQLSLKRSTSCTRRVVAGENLSALKQPMNPVPSYCTLGIPVRCTASWATTLL